MSPSLWNKWVFTYKFNADNYLTKYVCTYEARLVVWDDDQHDLIWILKSQDVYAATLALKRASAMNRDHQVTIYRLFMIHS